MEAWFDTSEKRDGYEKQLQYFRENTGCSASLFCVPFASWRMCIRGRKYQMEKNKADIGIYQTELSDFYEISFENPDTGISERTFERDVKNGIRLLMINGGFVPESDTVLQNGIIYAPLEKIAEPLGITYDLTRQEGKYLTLQKGDTTLVFPRYNESTVLLNSHEWLHLITCVIMIIYMCLYVLLLRPLEERCNMWMTTRRHFATRIIQNFPIG